MPRKNVNPEKLPGLEGVPEAGSSRGLNDSVLNAMTAGVAVLDKGGSVRTANEAWRSALWQDLLPPGAPTLPMHPKCADHNGTGRGKYDFSTGLVEVLEGKRPVLSYEYYRGPEGAARWFLITAMPINDEQGGAVVSHQEITGYRSAEEINQFKLRLNDVVRSLTSADEIIAMYARMLAEQVGADRCAYAEVDADENHFVVTGDYAGDKGQSIAGRFTMLQFGEESMRLLRAGEAFVVADVDNDPRILEADLPAYRLVEARSVVCLPLLKGGRLVAAMAVQKKTPRLWSANEVELLKSVVGRCWESLERARTEKKLRVSEERLKLASEALNAVVYDWDPVNDRITRSVELVELLGFAPDDENSTNAWWVSRLHPEDRSRSIRLVKDAISSRADRFVDEYRMMHRDGRYVWVLDSGIFIRGGDGKVLRCVGSVLDISGRKDAETALRKSESHSRAIRREIETLYRTAPVGMCQVDRDLRFVRINDRFAEINGATAKEHIGKTVSEMIPGFASAIGPIFERVMETGEPVINLEVEGETRAWPGVKRYWLGSWYPHADADGNVAGVNVVASEITERKVAEEQFRLSQERFRLAQEAGNVGIWDWDAVNSDTYWSDVMWRIYGRDPNAAPPDDELWRQLLHPDDRERVSKKLDDLIASTDTGYADRFRIDRGSNDVRWIETIAKVVRDSDGRAVRVSGVNIDITDRREAEGILDRYRLLSEHAHDFIWFFRPDGQLVEVSRSVIDAYGYTREELLSMNLRQIRHPSTHADLPAHIEAAILGNAQYETTHIRKDGSILRVEVTATMTEFGGERLILAINRDVTERKRADAELKYREEQLRTITNSVPALISYIDKDERYIFVNHVYTEWFNRPQEDFIGTRIRDVAGARAYREVKPYINEALRGNRVDFESDLDFQTAGRRFVRISYVPDIAEDGVVRGFYAMVNDVTSLRHSENLLRSSEERMDLIRENFTDHAILSTDTEGRVDSWNTGAENVFGYSEAEMLGKTTDILYTTEDVENGVPAAEMRAARKNGRAIDERWHTKKNGARFFASGVMIPLYVGKALTGYAKIATDLTEKKRQAEELQRAHDQLELRVLERTGELAESNTALIREIEERAIAENERVDLLRKLVTRQEDERRRIARDIHDTLGQRVTALRLKIASLQEVPNADIEITSRVQRLQEIAERLDAEVSFLAWELRPTTLDDLGLVDAIGAFLEEWSRHYEIAAEFLSNIVLKGRLDTEVETHLYRMTQEALNNIVKHAKATRVTVLLENRGDDLLLIIEDNGVGFDPHKQEVSRRSGKGLGLVGLRERAALFGGEVEIESAPGAGTTIFVKVPVLTSGVRNQ